MMKKILSVLLVALLLVTGPALIPASAETMPDFPREYKMFAVKKDGLYVTALDMGFESILTLNEDGTGLMTFDEEIEAVSRWTKQLPIRLSASDLTRSAQVQKAASALTLSEEFRV